MLRRLAGTVFGFQKRFGEVHGSSLAATVSLSAFLSLFPLLLVVIAAVGFVSRQSDAFAGSVISHLGLHGEAASAISSAIDQAERSRRVASVVGVAGLLWSGLGLVAALQFAFDAVWQTAGRGLRDKAVGLLWLVGSGAIVLASVGLTAAINFLPGWTAPIAILAAFGVDVVLWLWALKVLPNRDVGWRALLPGAVVGAVGFEVLKAAGGIWVPRMVASSSALYGAIGVVFAVLAWLLLFGRLVVYVAVVTVVQWEANYGTVTAEIELPRVPGQVPVRATRAGEGIRAR